MYALSNTFKNSDTRGAAFKLVGEFLMIFAVLMIVSQPFAAQAAPDLQVICGEQGVLMVDANGVEQDQNCPDCNKCADCATPSVRLLATLVDKEQFLAAAQSKADSPSTERRIVTDLIHSQMLRGPPSMTSEVNMLFPNQFPARLLGAFS